ncbi:MAG TPA: SIR2 family protein [Bryobacteraceae bacterium]|nr:SIR2 family protein [Bryobacteraceae bacterium]
MIPCRQFEAAPVEEILPLLAATYQSGQLVPFLGAGMSRKKLADWNHFVSALEEQACSSSNREEHLEVRAQRAAETIRNSQSDEDFWEILKKALRGEEFDKAVPEQTTALAEIYWPLTISTNYDHLFYCACRKIFEDRLPPMVLGRSAEDCKQLLSSLMSPFDRETIWHIQGFLGERCWACEKSPALDDMHLERLRCEIVIGHSEYRRATSTAIHFRRCFGEVFRTRSFLFLGSSLSEEYFWNLFGETLELCGPSPVPHFAFVWKKSKIDARFLAEEMNITACEYDDHPDLVQWIKNLKAAIVNPKARVSRWYCSLNGRSALEVVPHGDLPTPEQSEQAPQTAVAFVVRAYDDGQFELDQELVEQRQIWEAKFAGRSFESGTRVLSPESGVFAVRARVRSEDQREIDSVGTAIRKLLGRLDEHVRVLHLHMPSAGGTVPPVYGFIEAVRAFGEWTESAERPLLLTVHAGFQILLNLTSRQIGLQELLTSRLMRFWAILNPGKGKEPVRRVFHKSPRTPLREVLADILGDIGDRVNEWSISVCPSPRRTTESIAHITPSMSLCDAGVVFGSVLTLTRASRESGAIEPGAGI